MPVVFAEGCRPRLFAVVGELGEGGIVLGWVSVRSGEGG